MTDQEKPYHIAGMVIDCAFRSAGEGAGRANVARTRILFSRRVDEKIEELEIPLNLPAAAAAALLRELSLDEDAHYSQHLLQELGPTR